MRLLYFCNVVFDKDFAEGQPEFKFFIRVLAFSVDCRQILIFSCRSPWFHFRVWWTSASHFIFTNWLIISFQYRPASHSPSTTSALWTFAFPSTLSTQPRSPSNALPTQSHTCDTGNCSQGRSISIQSPASPNAILPPGISTGAWSSPSFFKQPWTVTWVSGVALHLYSN